MKEREGCFEIERGKAVRLWAASHYNPSHRLLLWLNNPSPFQFYSGGIFTGGCGTDLNHHVAVLGYGTGADGTKYWLVKNSWSRGWGEGGYVRMQRDVRSRQGLCGIAMKASYPTA
ncbi:hypothetical protein FF2_020439 [Malus domestica]